MKKVCLGQNRQAVCSNKNKFRRIRNSVNSGHAEVCTENCWTTDPRVFRVSQQVPVRASHAVDSTPLKLLELLRHGTGTRYGQADTCPRPEPDAASRLTTLTAYLYSEPPTISTVTLPLAVRDGVPSSQLGFILPSPNHVNNVRQ